MKSKRTKEFKELFRIIYWVLVGMIILSISAVVPPAPFNKWLFRLGTMVLGGITGVTASHISLAKSLFYSTRHKKKLLEKLATLEGLEGKPTQNP